jgi:DNA-binding transcriptional MerR regulator
VNDIQKIGEVAVRFSISGRTLRYYEDIGILQSIRNEESQYRYYDQEAINRLEQILFLRKMQIPIKDIQAIFTSKSIQVAIDVFKLKLKNLEEETEMFIGLKEMIKTFLSFLYEKASNNNELQFNKVFNLRNQLIQEVSIKKEVHEMSNKIVKELNDIRIIELKPMKVAYYRAESASPEMDAWKVMKKWVDDNRLEELATTRFFGFNNPNPSQNNPEYGYEVWVTVPDNIKESEQIKTKNFKGGLYCVTCCQLHDITEKWKRLVEWVKESEYDFGDYQCLEETISPDKNPNENTQFDLYCPIKMS